MNRFQFVVACVVGVVVCAQTATLAVLVMDRRKEPPARELTREAIVAPAGPSSASPAPPAVRNASAAPVSRAPAAAFAAAPAVATVPRPVDPARLQALQKKFEALSTQTRHDPDEIDALFGELIDAQGTSVVAGVDLNVLRQNIRLALDLQRVGEEMDAERKKPAPDAAKMENLRQKAAALQNRLTANLQGQPAATPPSAGSFAGPGR
jgi:hypothetical protein